MSEQGKEGEALEQHAQAAFPLFPQPVMPSMTMSIAASEAGAWTCPQCSYSNVDSGNPRCALCGKVDAGRDATFHKRILTQNRSTTETASNTAASSAVITRGSLNNPAFPSEHSNSSRPQTQEEKDEATKRQIKEELARASSHVAAVVPPSNRSLSQTEKDEARKQELKSHSSRCIKS